MANDYAVAYSEWERPEEATPRSWIFRCKRCKDISYWPIPKGHKAICGYRLCPHCGATMINAGTRGSV